jgi:hypothetical protein
MFSEKHSKPILFEEAAILADPHLEVLRICESPRGRTCRR